MKKTISGIRGIFGKDLTLKDVLYFCNNFSKLVESKKCVIGTDTRPSGDMIKKTVSAAIQENGIDVLDLGMSPTPVVFREARKQGSGIMITSSHNPIPWNGLKFIKQGRGINEIELETILKPQQIEKNKIGTNTKIESNYINDAAKMIGEFQNKPNIILDIGGGAAIHTAPALLQKLGCKIDVINKELNADRGPDPTVDNLTQLTEMTKNADIGFAFDLDGDRLVLVKDGEKLSPDTTLCLGVAKALEMGYKKFTLSIDSSIAVEKYIKEHGGKVNRSKVGEANVIELMSSTNTQAGGEGSSGGFILPEFNYCRDGILTSGFIASMIGENHFEDVISFMKRYHQVRDKIEVKSIHHETLLDDISQKIKQRYSDIDTLDGIKIIKDKDTWTLIRRSNTEDIFRVSTESNDPTKARDIQKDIIKLVTNSYEKIK